MFENPKQCIPSRKCGSRQGSSHGTVQSEAGWLAAELVSERFSPWGLSPASPLWNAAKMASRARMVASVLLSVKDCTSCK
jgi:hypothetical protein